VKELNVVVVVFVFVVGCVVVGVVVGPFVFDVAVVGLVRRKLKIVQHLDFEKYIPFETK
jgi:hypothetical protein